MNKLINFRTLIGLVVIALALWNTKTEKDIQLIQVDKPTQEIIEIVAPVSHLITDPTDRAKLAIFNQTFANRVKGYDTDLQQVNDVYVLAGSHFFENTLVDKYKDLDTSLISLIEKAAGTDNHKLTDQEKEKLASYFMGLAWSLIQKK